MIASLLKITPKEYKRVVPALFAYLFNRIDMERFIKFVGDREEGTRIKDIARQNGYIMKNCKLYAYAVYFNRVNGKKIPAASEFKVAQYDSLILRRLNLQHLDTKIYRAFTLHEFDHVVKEMVISAEIRNNIGKFVSKKMSFLVKSYGERREDIESYLKEMAIAATYMQYPRFMTYLHMINVAKAQIHNKGQTFITASTTQSRQRLTKLDGGDYEAVHADLSTAAELAEPVNYAVEIKEQIMALSQIENVLPERTKEFLLCAAGQYHEGFSLYLKVQNDLAAEKMNYGRYMVKLQTYFNTTPEKVEKLFSSIRNKIYQTTT